MTDTEQQIVTDPEVYMRARDNSVVRRRILALVATFARDAPTHLTPGSDAQEAGLNV